MRRRIGLLLLSLSVPLLFLGASDALGQERSIRGTVVDSASGQPVSNPIIQVRGTEIGAIGEEDGTFVLDGAPEGVVTLVVQRIGYLTREVSVGQGVSQVTVRLPVDRLQMEELVVTGRATERLRRNLPTSVASVSGDEVTRTSQQTLDKALQGRITGAVVSQNSGAPGGGVQVQLRGASSINARSAPLYVIDGVIMSNEAIPSNANAITAAATGSNPSLDQDNQQNRIADLNPEDIENIEVLKGPAAAAIYGSKGSNGVIIIETTSGAGVGEATRWRITARGGLSDLSNKVGSRVFETKEEAEEAFGETLAQEWEENSQEFFDGGTPFFDHEEQLADNDDPSWELGATASGGGVGGLQYFASALAKDQQGIIPNTGMEKQSLRVNLTQDIGDRTTVTVNTNLLRTDTRRGLTNNDNSQTSYFMVYSATPSFVDLEQRPDGSFPRNPAVGNGSNPLQTTALMDKSETVYRLLGSTTIDTELMRTDRHDLTLRATGGVDWFGQTNDIFSPPELHFEDADGFLGSKLLSKSDNLQFNVNLNGVWNFQPSEGTTWRTSAGVQYEFSDLRINRTTGENLTGGKDKIDAATVISVRESRQQIEDFGFYVQEELLTFDERLLLTGAVRLDQSSANADDSALFVFPHASASFRFPDLGGFADELKLRAAFGTTGNRPLFGQEFTSLELTKNIQGLPGFTIQGNVADPDLQPERQTEVEGGFDLTAFGGRAQLGVTGYRQVITDLILQRELAPSSGFNTKFFNGGELQSRGLEVTLDATPVASADLEWSTRLSFDLNRTEVTELPVSSFVTGSFGASLGAFRVEEGKSLSQIVGTDPRPVAGDDGLVQLGDANPDFNVSFSNDLRWGGFRLYHLWDARPGFQVINLTELLYDAFGVSDDWEDGDGVIAPPEDLDPETQEELEYESAEGCFPDCSGVERIVGFASGFPRSYVQDAGFVKLREVTLSWELPSQTVGRFFGGAFDAVRLELSGRNLLTFTPYRGHDPEVSNFGQENFARNVDVAPYPPSRTFWLSLDLTF